MNQKNNKGFSKHFKKQLLKERGYWTSTQIAQTWAPGHTAPAHKSMTGWIGGDNEPLGRGEQELPRDGDIPTNLPFPLGNITEELADAYMSITKTEINIQTCIDQNIVVVGEKELLLRKQLQAVKKLKEDIRNIAANIERLTLNI